MTVDEKYTKTIRVRIDPELLEHVKSEAERLNSDMSTYVRWCIRTGLYLDELNIYIRSRGDELE